MMLLYHSMRKKKRPERVVEDADPCDVAQRASIQKKNPVITGFFF